jgi:hypothetical protein
MRKIAFPSKIGFFQGINSLMESSRCIACADLDLEDYNRDLTTHSTNMKRALLSSFLCDLKISSVAKAMESSILSPMGRKHKESAQKTHVNTTQKNHIKTTHKMRIETAWKYSTHLISIGYFPQS